MLLVYLPRPINSRNTIIRKNWFAIVFLGSIFLKTLKMHSQVKSLLKILYTYLHCDFLTNFISNNTHRLLVLSTTSCRYPAQNNAGPTRAVKVRPKWGINRPNFESCIDIERPIFLKIRQKKLNIYTNHSPVYMEKSCPR